MNKEKIRDWVRKILTKYREEHDWRLDDDVYLDALIDVINNYFEIEKLIKEKEKKNEQK